jgi:hypothetical protein
MTCTPTPLHSLACTLTPDDFHVRRSLFAGLVHRSVGRVTPVRGGEQARLVAGSEIESQLQELATLEAECCAFLPIAVRSSDDQTVLEVTGPPQAQALIADLLTGHLRAEG